MNDRMFNDLDPVGHFLNNHNQIQKDIAEQAKPNPIIQRHNFGKPERTEPFGGYYEKPRSTNLMGSVSVIDVNKRKNGKKEKKSTGAAGAIFWLIVILFVVGLFAG